MGATRVLAIIGGSSGCSASWSWQISAATGRHQQCPTGRLRLGTGIGSFRQLLGRLPFTLNLGRITVLLIRERRDLSRGSSGHWSAQFQRGEGDPLQFNVATVSQG